MITIDSAWRGIWCGEAGDNRLPLANTVAFDGGFSDHSPTMGFFTTASLKWSTTAAMEVRHRAFRTELHFVRVQPPGLYGPLWVRRHHPPPSGPVLSAIASPARRRIVQAAPHFGVAMDDRRPRTMAASMKTMTSVS